MDENQGNQNNAPPSEDLDAIRTQLASEQVARAALETASVEKDTRITALETELSEAKQVGEARDTQLTASAAELATVTTDRELRNPTNSSTSPRARFMKSVAYFT